MAERRSARESGLSEHAARWTASMVMESGKPMRTLLLPARLKSLSAWLWRFREGMEAGSQNAVTLRWNFWEMEKREFGSWKSRTARPYAPATPALPHPTGHLINGPDWTAGEEQPLAPRASWAATNFAPEGSLPTETGNARRYHTLAPRRTDHLLPLKTCLGFLEFLRVEIEPLRMPTMPWLTDLLRPLCRISVSQAWSTLASLEEVVNPRLLLCRNARQRPEKEWPSTSIKYFDRNCAVSETWGFQEKTVS